MIAAAACQHIPAVPEAKHAPGMVTFTYTPPPGAPPVTAVTVPGSFNHWSTTALPMTRRADGSWQASVQLDAGEYEYKFYINGGWPADMCGDPVWGDPRRSYWIDPAADACEPDGNEGRNAIIIVADTAVLAGVGFQHDPGSPAHLSAAAGRISVRLHVNARQLTGASIIVASDTFAMHHQLTYRSRDVWRASLPSETATYRVRLQTTTGPQEHGPFSVPDSLFTDVPWVGSAIGYQIFPERFRNGDPANDHHALASDAWHRMHPQHRGAPPVLMQDWGGEPLDTHCCHQYFGGDLQGIIDRLDHLESLGVTLIYLNPIFHAGSAHGYDTYDYLTVAPAFGDEQTLRALLDAARARGIRVMWDFVPNHVGVGHWAFQDAVQHGRQSHYWSWFRFNVPHREIRIGNGADYESWSGFGSLPKLDTRNSDVLSHLLEVTRHWTAFGFDAIRVDVPNEIVNRKEFFRAFRRAAKGAKPDVYLVGEIWQRSPDWVQGDEFDALMNYAIGQRVIERFVTGAVTAVAAKEEMSRLYAEYPEASVAMQFNLISSHDTGRLLTRVGGGELGDAPTAGALARQRLSSAMLYALPGMPVTFQGDECALLGSGSGRELNRYPVQWQACDTTMLGHYRRLVALRRDTPALTSPVFRAYHAESTVLAFYRGEPGDDEVLVVFNSGAVPGTLALPPGTWIDRATGDAHIGVAEIPGAGWRYLRRR